MGGGETTNTESKDFHNEGSFDGGQNPLSHEGEGLAMAD